jgi:hypothetical protein
MAKRFEFYVGISKSEESKFFDLLEDINLDSEYSIAKMIGFFDDPDSYYTFVVEGTMDAYKRFYRVTKEGNLSWVKSLYHYEE